MTRPAGKQPDRQLTCPKRENTMTDTSQDLLFDLTLTDEQRMNRESMQRFAAAEMRTLSKAVDAGDSPARDFYPKTAELGLTLLPILYLAMRALGAGQEGIAYLLDGRTLAVIGTIVGVGLAYAGGRDRTCCTKSTRPTRGSCCRRPPWSCRGR